MRSYRTFSPLPAAVPELGGLFSVALSLGRPRGVTSTLPSVPDFPSPPDASRGTARPTLRTEQLYDAGLKLAPPRLGGRATPVGHFFGAHGPNASSPAHSDRPRGEAWGIEPVLVSSPRNLRRLLDVVRRGPDYHWARISRPSNARALPISARLFGPARDVGPGSAGSPHPHPLAPGCSPTCTLPRRYTRHSGRIRPLRGGEPRGVIGGSVPSLAPPERAPATS